MIGQDEISSGMTSGAAVLPRAVRRALDFMHGALERDIGIAELATAAGLSARAMAFSNRADAVPNIPPSIANAARPRTRQIPNTASGGNVSSVTTNGTLSDQGS